MCCSLKRAQQGTESLRWSLPPRWARRSPSNSAQSGPRRRKCAPTWNLGAGAKTCRTCWLKKWFSTATKTCTEAVFTDQHSDQKNEIHWYPISLKDWDQRLRSKPSRYRNGGPFFRRRLTCDMVSWNALQRLHATTLAGRNNEWMIRKMT